MRSNAKRNLVSQPQSRFTGKSFAGPGIYIRSKDGPGFQKFRARNVRGSIFGFIITALDRRSSELLRHNQFLCPLQ